MKISYCWFLMICSFILSSCDILTNDTNHSEKIVCTGTYTENGIEKDSVFFNESDIKWLDTTSHQLKFKEPLTLNDIRFFRKFKFYAGTDSLFTASLALDIMSSIVDDLVLRYGSYDGNIYLEDSYPEWVNDSITIANRQKRAANWNRFIDRLDKVNKIK